MLSDEKIISALNNQEIEIYVSFEMKEGEVKTCDTEKGLLESSLKDNIYSDRLKLTMGPIVKVLNNKWVNSKYRFNKSKDCFDLRKADNKYIIRPGESVIVLTNERIKLNGKYACLVVPRISLSDVGVVVTTAYVDPFYHGVMRLHLSNLSDKPYELRTLEAIAQCFFFEMSDLVSEIYKENFSQKSVFFGQSWHEILGSDRNPFPTKKEAAIVDKFSNLKYQAYIVWSQVKKHSLIFLLITNIVVILGGFTTFKKNFEKYTMTMEQIEDCLEPISSEIIIEPEEIYGEKEIVVQYSKADIISVLCNNEEIHYKILSGTVENETKIVFSFSESSVSSDRREINFSYVIVRRIK